MDAWRQFSEGTRDVISSTLACFSVSILLVSWELLEAWTPESRSLKPSSAKNKEDEDNASKLLTQEELKVYGSVKDAYSTVQYGSHQTESQWALNLG